MWRMLGVGSTLFILVCGCSVGDETVAAEGHINYGGADVAYTPFTSDGADSAQRPSPVDEPDPVDPRVDEPDPVENDPPPERREPPAEPGSTIEYACNQSPPPGAAVAPPPKPYSGGTCPMLVNGTNTLPSGGANREFRLVVPEGHSSADRLPVLFLWHWLKGSANSFYKKGQIQVAVDTQRFVAVIPEDKGDLFLQWPFDALSPAARFQEELTFFDDMLACVSEQFPVEKNCVTSVGVSAGALWTVQLASYRSEYLNAMISLSGGVGGITKPWQPPTRKIPSVVLWGGPWDSCIFNNFQDVSLLLENHLNNNGQFLVECIHNCQHGEPPMTEIEGKSKYAPIWEFAFDHAYWLAPGESPYTATGLPQSWPSWCEVGSGNASIRIGECEPPGCPF